LQVEISGEAGLAVETLPDLVPSAASSTNRSRRSGRPPGGWHSASAGRWRRSRPERLRPRPSRVVWRAAGLAAQGIRPACSFVVAEHGPQLPSAIASTQSWPAPPWLSRSGSRAALDGLVVRFPSDEAAGDLLTASGRRQLGTNGMLPKVDGVSLRDEGVAEEGDLPRAGWLAVAVSLGPGAQVEDGSTAALVFFPGLGGRDAPNRHGPPAFWPARTRRLCPVEAWGERRLRCR
jgi:hypothetical protein